MKNRMEEPQESMLTQRMDVGTQGFNDFQAILLSKSIKRTESQKMGIDLLTIKYIKNPAKAVCL
jgi:hypothetical protein